MLVKALHADSCDSLMQMMENFAEVFGEHDDIQTF